MRIAIVGAGAIGGYIGGRLCQAGADVVLLARGAHLDAMARDGLRIQSPDGDADVRPVVTDDPGCVSTADVVLLAVKAHALPALAPVLGPRIGPDATVVGLQNGVPWWLDIAGRHLERVDPGGVVASSFGHARVLGALVYISADVVAPGVVRHTDGHRVSLGEPDGSRSDHARRVAEPLIAAGLRCPVTTRLRHEVWVKLLGNVAFNPMSVLTGQTLGVLATHGESVRLAREVMREAEAVAAALGVDLPVSVDQRIAGAARAGAHRTSMLQDADAGRPTELDAIVGAVVELGDALGMPMPATQALYACTRLRLDGPHDAA